MHLYITISLSNLIPPSQILQFSLSPLQKLCLKIIIAAMFISTPTQIF